MYASNSEMMEVSYDDNWTDPMMSNFALERPWNGISIFIEESPIQSVGDISLDDFMDMDYENCKEGWEALERMNPVEVSTVKTESGYLASRISQAE